MSRRAAIVVEQPAETLMIAVTMIRYSLGGLLREYRLVA